MKWIKIKKHLTMIFSMGLVYLVFELLSRWMSGSMIGFHVTNMIQSKLSLTGWTSFWMLPVGGLTGYFLGWMNQFKWTNKIPMIIQGLIGTIIIIWPLELSSGIILNRIFELGIWDYSMDMINLLGQISLSSLPGFIFVSIFAFWYDDFLRHWYLDEKRPQEIFKYYWYAITFRNINKEKYK